jgi:hypothetical protein
MASIKFQQACLDYLVGQFELSKKAMGTWGPGLPSRERVAEVLVEMGMLKPGITAPWFERGERRLYELTQKFRDYWEQLPLEAKAV